MKNKCGAVIDISSGSDDEGLESMQAKQDTGSSRLSKGKKRPTARQLIEFLSCSENRGTERKRKFNNISLGSNFSDVISLSSDEENELNLEGPGMPELVKVKLEASELEAYTNIASSSDPPQNEIVQTCAEKIQALEHEEAEARGCSSLPEKYQDIASSSDPPENETVQTCAEKIQALEHEEAETRGCSSLPEKYQFVGDQSQCSRKRLHDLNDESTKVTNLENDELKRKCRKLSANKECPAFLKNRIHDETNKIENFHNLQESLHCSLKPELKSLCDVLKLPEDVKTLALKYLDYIMNNIHVNSYSELKLQAFKISLCWRAASCSKHKINHEECLALAKKYLKYVCNYKQAESMYSKLHILKKKHCQISAGSFHHTGDINSSSSKIDTDQQQRVEESTSMHLNNPELGEVSDRLMSSEEMISEQQQGRIPEASSKIHKDINPPKDESLEKRLTLIHKICSKRLNDLLLEQQREHSYFSMQREEEKLKLISKHKSDLDLAWSKHTDSTVSDTKVELLKQEYCEKMAECDKFMKYMNAQWNKLWALQDDARRKEEEIRVRWLEEAKAGSLTESFVDLPLTESSFKLEPFYIVGSDDMISPRPDTDEQSNGLIETGYRETNEPVREHLETPSILPGEMVDDIPVETNIAACSYKSTTHFDSTEPTEAYNLVPTGLSDTASHIHNERLVDEPPVVGILVSESCSMIETGHREANEQVREHSKTPPVLPSKTVDDIPVETEVAACLFNNTSQLDSSEPTGASVSRSGIDQICGCNTTVSPEAPGISSHIPSERLVNVPLDVGIVVSESSFEVEYIEPTEMSQIVSTGTLSPTVLTGTHQPNMGGLTMETDITPSVSFEMSAERNVVAPVHIDSTIGAPMTTADKDLEEGGGNCLLSCSQEIRAESGSHTLVAVSSEFDPVLLGSTTSVAMLVPLPVKADLHADETNLDVSCLNSFLRENQAVSASSLPATTSSVCDVLVTPDQQLSVGEHEMPALCSMQAEEFASVDITLTENGQASTHVQDTSSNNLQTDVSMQQPISNATAQGDESNQLVSSSGAPPLPPNFSMPLDHTRAEHLGNSDVRFMPGCQSSLMPPLAATPALSCDPYLDQLLKIARQNQQLQKNYEEKKRQLQIERESETGKELQKLNVMLKDVESRFIQDKKILETFYEKVVLNQTLGNMFRRHFIDRTQDFIQASQAPGAPSTTPRPANLPAHQNQVKIPLTQTPPGPQAMASIPSVPILHHSPGLGPRLKAPLVPHTSQQVGSRPHARFQAPHLGFRSPLSSPAQSGPQAMASIPSGPILRHSPGVGTQLSAGVGSRPRARCQAPHLGFWSPISSPAQSSSSPIASGSVSCRLPVAIHRPVVPPLTTYSVVLSTHQSPHNGNSNVALRPAAAGKHVRISG